MKKTIIEAIQNAKEYGFNNFHSDFESEADLNAFLTWAAAFNDEHTTINTVDGASIGMPI